MRTARKQRLAAAALSGREGQSGKKERVPRRGPYRDTQKQALAALEARRAKAGVTVKQLCERAGLDASTYRRMMRTGLAFQRRLIALRMALREIEKMQRQQPRLFRTEGT